MLHAIDIRVRREDRGDPPTSVQIPRGVARGRPCPALIRDARTRSNPRPRPCGSRPYGRPGHENRYAYRPFCRRRMVISRGVWESHNPRTLQVEAPDARSAPPRSAPPLPSRRTRRLHHPLLRSVPHHARRRRVHVLVVPQHRTGQESRVGNDTIMSWTVIELSPSRTVTDFAPFHGRDRRARRARTVGHTPGSTTPSHRVPGSKVRVLCDRVIAGELYPLLVRFQVVANPTTDPCGLPPTAPFFRTSLCPDGLVDGRA